jgi:lipopolysaccharide biosynthesis protein
MSAMESVERNSKDDNTPRLIAFYLTQFHPIPENDSWWGKGFTEWTNVTKASPLFEGHYQPHLPSDFGFYDLRVKETRHEQIKYAREYGVDGFCYYYYWFSGKRVLHRPLDEMLADPESDMPFCLCWANENWSRRWDAAEHDVLLAQRYLPDDDLNFIKSLVPFLKDPRYIRVEGKPLVIVYRPQQLPNARETANIWRQYCREIGIGEIQIVAALTHGNLEYLQFGFDGGVEFPPHNISPTWINDSIAFKEPFKGGICEYGDIANSYLQRGHDGLVYKTVFPSWDNTARRRHRSLVVLNGTPENYEYWLASTIDLAKQNQQTDPLVFINAWNEWAEGCHLEPDIQHRHAFLEATLNAKKGSRRFTEFTNWGTSSTVVDEKASSLAEDISLLLQRHTWRKLQQARKIIKRRPAVELRLKGLAGQWRRFRRALANLIRSNN